MSMVVKQTPPPSRLSPPSSRSLLLCLALFVFAWGLQYKLSLYDPPQSQSHCVPAAKLLSKNERASKIENLLERSADVVGRGKHSVLSQVYVLFLLTLDPCAAPASRSRVIRPEQFVVPSSCTGMTAFFFRPPPILT
jgi:hypothetical protein